MAKEFDSEKSALDFFADERALFAVHLKVT